MFIPKDLAWIFRRAGMVCNLPAIIRCHFFFDSFFFTSLVAFLVLSFPFFTFFPFFAFFAFFEDCPAVAFSSDPLLVLKTSSGSDDRSVSALGSYEAPLPLLSNFVEPDILFTYKVSN